MMPRRLPRLARRTVAVGLVLGASLLAATAFSAPPPSAAPPGHAPAPAMEGPGHGEGHEHAEAEEHGPEGMNWTDFSNHEKPPYLAAVINFAILVAIYVYFGKKPIADALKGRRNEVAKQIEEAQQIKREAEGRAKQYASKLGELNDELTRTRATLVASGVAEKARIVREAEEKAARMQKDALFMLEQERKQVRLDLQRETVLAALAEAEGLLRTKLTQADQERVAEEFLATLVPGKGKSAVGGAS